MEAESKEIQELIEIDEKAQLPKPIKPRDYKRYRNNDLKNIFGMCNNTINKYRVTGIFPYTKLGDITLYKVQAVNKILKDNKVEDYGKD
jgi:hypothetical protein